MPYISLAQFGRKVGYFNLLVLTLNRIKRIIGFFYGFFKNRRNLARDSENALAVRSVSGNSYIENVIVQSQQRLYVCAVFGIVGQYQQSAIIPAVEHIAVDSELRARTEHTLGLYSAELTLFNCRNAFNGNVVLRSCINGCAYECAGRLNTLFDVVGSATYLENSLIAAINLADGKVSAFDGFAFYYFADDDSRYILAYIYEFFNLESAAEQFAL